MSTNLNSPISSARAITGEGWAAIIGAIGSAFLLAKKLLSPKSAGKTELVSRAEFCAEMLATRERFHTNHLTIPDLTKPSLPRPTQAQVHFRD